MGKVSLVKCTEYRADLLEDAIGRSLANIGFSLKDFENKNVALKPNFLMTSAVDKAICPAGAIEKAEGSRNVPRYDYDKCIRCYCCMEICPEAAVELKSGALEWLLPGS